MAEQFDRQKVWFVGAGPGDISLITLKGYRILQQADIVIYAGSLSILIFWTTAKTASKATTAPP